jgi:dCTP deaminase
MPTLSKTDILKEIQSGNINFTPQLDQYQIQPNSIDLRLGNTFYIPKAWEYTEEGRRVLRADYLDIQTKKDNFKILNLKPGQYFEIISGEFIIASTLEKIEIKTGHLMAVMYARSSLIRRGLRIESGIVDAGYQGYLMIPIINNTNGQIIRLYPGERICQLVLHTLSTPLSNEETQKHGLAPSKYDASTPYNLEAHSDNLEEIKLIQAGRLTELKEKYLLTI